MNSLIIFIMICSYMICSSPNQAAHRQPAMARPRLKSFSFFQGDITLFFQGNTNRVSFIGFEWENADLRLRIKRRLYVIHRRSPLSHLPEEKKVRRKKSQAICYINPHYAHS
jgi:hypothetical protein